MPLLTFDDGPAKDTPALLDLLARHGVTATFFVIGERVERDPDLVRRTAGEGHTVGNHSWSHPVLKQLMLDQGAEPVRTQLARTSDAIEAVLGSRPMLFRPPYGSTNEDVNAVAASLGMETVLWDAEAADWTSPGADAIVVELKAAADNTIFLLHDGHAEGEQDRMETVTAVDRFLTERAGR